jgi:hypothetical protein
MELLERYAYYGNYFGFVAGILDPLVVGTILIFKSAGGHSLTERRSVVDDGYRTHASLATCRSASNSWLNSSARPRCYIRRCTAILGSHRRQMTMTTNKSVPRALRLTLRALPLCAVIAASAPGLGHAGDLPAWNNHAPPYVFLFNGGAHIDTHQQSSVNKPADTLTGFLYIQFTDAVSSDGYRVASHTDCNGPGATCTVGWRLKGKRTTATLVYHVEEDHPTWLVGRDDVPQPGAYSHFHWSDTAEHPGVGTTHTGYLMQLVAADTFCFVHGDPVSFQTQLTCEDEVNDGVIVRPGSDVATHLNIVGSYPGYQAP